MNHDLEDKILQLVQQNDEEQQQIMSIHEDLHKKLKIADQRVQDIIQEKVRQLPISTHQGYRTTCT